MRYEVPAASTRGHSDNDSAQLGYHLKLGFIPGGRSIPRHRPSTDPTLDEIKLTWFDGRTIGGGRKALPRNRFRHEARKVHCGCPFCPLAVAEPSRAEVP
jgi:hypothetical protein